VINAADFGILSDQDSTVGFTALGDRLRSDPARAWEVTFAPGAYGNTDPRWLDGVHTVRLVGNGSSLQMLTPNAGMFTGGEPFRTPAGTHIPGVRIASAAAGDTALRVLEPIGRLRSGDMALIAGRNQQFQNLHLTEDQWQINGWPPNLRWFEYVTIGGVLGDHILLEAPLVHSYDETWRDYPGNYFAPFVAGAPRLYLLDRPDWHIARSIEFHGFTFLRAKDSTDGGHIGFSLPALRLHLEDCTIEPGGFVQMAREITMRDCTWTGPLEVDKIIGRLAIEDCDIAGLASDGAGALEVDVRRSRIYGDFRINPRTSVAIDSATSFGNFSLNAHHGGYYTTDPVTITVRASRP
jgi:hypothetical protein